MENRQNINLVELRGVVGTARLSETGSGRIVRFSLATNYIYKETTWHNCLALEGKHVIGIDKIMKGTAVHLTGRIRCYRFIDINNAERTGNEIVVNTLEVL